MADTTALEPVTVTAQKREQLLTDVPLSIQAFTDKDLQKAGVAELGELIRYIPGASQGVSNSYGYQTYQLRGTGVVTGDSTVAYYLDEAAFSLLGSNVAPVGRTFDVNRVEVLRGPQGTLFGLGALGGAIRFVTADPSLSQFEAKMQVGFDHTSGGASGYFGDLAVSAPIIEGQLAGRAVVDFERKGGYVSVSDFPGQQDLDPTRIRNFRGKLLWEPSDAVTVKLTYQHNEVKQDVGTLLVSADPPVATQGSNAGLGSVMTKYDLVSAFASVNVGPGKIESSTGYLTWYLDQTAFLTIGGPVEAKAMGRQPTFTEELRYVSNPGGLIDWVAGGFYKHAKSEGGDDYSGAFTFNSSQTETSDNYAVFAEASANLDGGTWVPLIGVRSSWDHRGSEAGTVDQSDTFKAFTPRFNLAYTPASDRLFFVNIARGARSGLFNNPALVPIAQSFGVPASNTAAPDSLWSYEVGAKGTLFGGAVAYDVAAYHTDWKDVQIIVAPQPGLGVTVNAGRAIGDGIDYGFSFQAARGVSFILSGNINNTRLRNLPSYVANASATDGLYDGARMPYVPYATNTVAVNVDQPLPAASLRFIGYASYSHASGQNEANSGLTSDPVNLVSARVGIRRDKVAVTLFGDNLTNNSARTYREFGLINRPYPRTVGVKLNYDI